MPSSIHVPFPVPNSGTSQLLLLVIVSSPVVIPSFQRIRRNNIGRLCQAGVLGSGNKGLLRSASGKLPYECLLELPICRRIHRCVAPFPCNEAILGAHIFDQYIARNSGEGGR